MEPAVNIKILLGNTEFGGIGYPGNWKTERRVYTDDNGYFSMTKIECRSWAIILASNNQVLEDYDVTPISYVIEIEEDQTHEIEFILIQKDN